MRDQAVAGAAVKAPNVDELPAEVLEIAMDEGASNWLRGALFDAIAQRDPLDALHDAEALAGALKSWVKHVFRVHGVEMPA